MNTSSRGGVTPSRSLEERSLSTRSTARPVGRLRATNVATLASASTSPAPSSVAPGNKKKERKTVRCNRPNTAGAREMGRMAVFRSAVLFVSVTSLVIPIVDVLGFDIEGGLDGWDADADHYRTLGLRRGAHPSEVKRAFRRMSLLYHPDKQRQQSHHAGGGGDARASEAAKRRFERIVEAHDALVDAKRRRAYDATLDGRGRRSQRTREDRRWASSSPLRTMRPGTIARDIAGSESMWLVLFRGGRWCEVCDDAETRFHDMARELRGVANLGVLDCDTEADLDAAW